MTRFCAVGIVGSLRHGSLNRALLNAAVGLAPPALAIGPRSLGDILLCRQHLSAFLIEFAAWIERIR